MRYGVEEPCLFVKDDEVVCAFSLFENNFNNQKTCELQIVGMEHAGY